jgi:hypothetical protein
MPDRRAASLPKVAAGLAALFPAAPPGMVLGRPGVACVLQAGPPRTDGCTGTGLTPPGAVAADGGHAERERVSRRCSTADTYLTFSTTAGNLVTEVQLVACLAAAVVGRSAAGCTFFVTQARVGLLA